MASYLCCFFFFFLFFLFFLFLFFFFFFFLQADEQAHAFKHTGSCFALELSTLITYCSSQCVLREFA
jgi:hypothetical protein